MKITKIFFSLIMCLCSKAAISQLIIETYLPAKDSLRIGLDKNDFLPYNEKGYTLILPETIPLQGVLISLEDRRFNLKDSAQQIYPQATAKGFAVLYISTGIPVDLFFSSKSLLYVDTLLKSVFNKYKIPNHNVFFLGVSLAGHRALKYAVYCQEKKSLFNPDTKGFILCEGVLDWVRQWYEAKKGVKDNFAESSVFEGKLICYLLEKYLGGTPKNHLEKYLEFSSYSYFDERNRYLKYYKEYSFRTYSEPATYYWVSQKRKTVWDTNFPDMVGIINELKLAGNNKSEFILYNLPKTNMDRRSPNYTWGLVDKQELMNWVVTAR